MREDILTFKIGNTEDVKFTRRGLLSKLAEVFDPLGLAAPSTIKAKIKMQKLSIANSNWDDLINEQEIKWWKEWLEDLQWLETVKVPRCLIPFIEDMQTELHIFCDASEEAFAAVAYIRNIQGEKYIEDLELFVQSRHANLKQPFLICVNDIVPSLFFAVVENVLITMRPQCVLTRSVFCFAHSFIFHSFILPICCNECVK